MERRDMVRKVEPIGAALVWCRNCSMYARLRLGPKLMDRRRLKCVVQRRPKQEVGWQG